MQERTSDLYLKAKQVQRGSMGRMPTSVHSSEYTSQNLNIHEDAEGNVFVKDLSCIPVTTADEVCTPQPARFHPLTPRC